MLNSRQRIRSEEEMVHMDRDNYTSAVRVINVDGIVAIGPSEANRGRHRM